MELTANRRPFLYFLLRHHFEQNFHVRHRLERYGAGKCMDFDRSTPDVWLAHPRRARWHLHFTPTSSSWLNLVERWFKELTDRRLRRGVFTSVDDLTEAIATWVAHWNDDPKPFVCHKTAAEIIEKVQRGGRATLHQIKSPTQH